jgi:hypothetical protein
LRPSRHADEACRQAIASGAVVLAWTTRSRQYGWGLKSWLTDFR